VKKLCWTLLGLISLFCSLQTFAAKTAVILEINGPIGPATENYIDRGLSQAANEKAALAIIQIDTPGGFETSMLGINKKILASKVPVVAYVSPSGARAASAGTFILYASHIAAMAPGTNVGAASPVGVSAFPSTSEPTKNTSTLQKKATNDAVAYIRSLAELRHRNIAWAEDAVRNGVSLSAEEALKKQVIDVIATDIPDLFTKINGKAVDVNKIPLHLDTTDLTLETIHPDWRSQFLSIITHPSIAYILLLIGIYGVFFELMNPGLILPGVVGFICLLIGLYAFQLLPVSYVGLSLILAGIACIMGEIYITSYGVLGIGGIIAFILGSILLFNTDVPGFQLPWSVIIIMTIISGAFFILVLWLAASAMRRPQITGREGMIGSTGEVVEYYTDYILVRVHGEIWHAHCDQPLQIGQSVRIKKIGDLKLTVEPISEPEKK